MQVLVLKRKKRKEIFYTCVLGLAEVELTFFVTACTVLGFGFVDRTAFLTPTLWLLLNSACTASLIKLSSSGPTIFLTFSLPVPFLIPLG